MGDNTDLSSPPQKCHVYRKSNLFQYKNLWLFKPPMPGLWHMWGIINQILMFSNLIYFSDVVIFQCYQSLYILTVPSKLLFLHNTNSLVFLLFSDFILFLWDSKHKMKLYSQESTCITQEWLRKHTASKFNFNDCFQFMQPETHIKSILIWYILFPVTHSFEKVFIVKLNYNGHIIPPCNNTTCLFQYMIKWNLWSLKWCLNITIYLTSPTRQWTRCASIWIFNMLL